MLLNNFFDCRLLAKICIITIYNEPTDFPESIIARLFDANVATDYYCIADTLEEMRTLIPQYMVNIGRMPEDDPVIIEVWI